VRTQLRSGATSPLPCSGPASSLQPSTGVPNPHTRCSAGSFLSNIWIGASRAIVFQTMSLWNDVRFGARTLAKTPGFAITIIIRMAFGIGATTAIFSVSDAMLWKPVPLPRLDSLTMVLQRVAEDPHEFNNVNTGDLADIRRANSSLEDIAYWGDGLAN